MLLKGPSFEEILNEMNANSYEIAPKIDKSLFSKLDNLLVALFLCYLTQITNFSFLK